MMVEDNTRVVVDMTLPTLPHNIFVGICVQPPATSIDKCIDLLYFIPKQNYKVVVQTNLKKILKVTKTSRKQIQLVFDPFSLSYAGKLHCFLNDDRTSGILHCAGQTLLAMREYTLFHCVPCYLVRITMDIIVNYLLQDARY